MDNRAQVREFLASRRARITPDQAGLPAYGGNRRVKGLRREEVALLAGVSIDYYIRMERGDLAGASEAVLDGVANALQLDEAEREHLRALARSAGPIATRRARPSPATVRPVIQQVLDAITEAPAWIRNARHDILAMNPLARALYSPVLDSAVAGATAKRAANTTRFIYLDPAAREFFVDYDRIATDAAAMLRLEAGRNPHDKDLITLVGELSTQSELFRQHWASHNVKFHRSGRKRLRHPAVGELDLNFEAMELPSEPDLRLNLYTADPDTPAADGLKLLASWAATRAVDNTGTSRRSRRSLISQRPSRTCLAARPTTPRLQPRPLLRSGAWDSSGGSADRRPRARVKDRDHRCIVGTRTLSRVLARCSRPLLAEPFRTLFR